ncbi:hypothetical protein [Noviherbaspirillum saxi]|uniref:hypothetical protein n=1 Tax=Noviherbaspirillum saxi TaxID=2320863 RepID=UPI0011C44B13|nr:hypothetical protein [Noviherbaspirillum saxi]
MSGVSFTLPNVSLSQDEFTPGEILTQKDAEEIVKNSGGRLRIENGRIVGENSDGSGDVSIKIGEPLSDGEIHDLHHTVIGSGGNGNDGSRNPGPLNGGSHH